MGFGNTKEEVTRIAKTFAAELTKLELIELGPKKWKPKVWENLGWHYKAVSPCGRWKVHPHHDRCDVRKKVKSYTAFLGDKVSAGGYYAESGKTPREAVVATATKAYEDILWRAALLDIAVPPRKYA